MEISNFVQGILNHGSFKGYPIEPIIRHGNGVSVEYTKGLEFDAVLIYNPTKENYPVDNGHVKLLYVAATRALHELTVVHQGDLTELI